MFTSALNFKSDGTFPAATTADPDSNGLNPSRAAQVFLTPMPVQSTGPFTRITNIPGGLTGGIRAFPSKSRRRMAFSLAGTELGGGNPDGSIEAYYHFSPDVTTESTATISLFTIPTFLSLLTPTPSRTPVP